MAIEILNGPVIEAGQSLSDGLDCSAGEIVKLTMPSDWTFAEITFQTSSDGQGYNDIMRPNGTEVMCTVFESTAIIGLGLVRGFLKIRSGTRDRPVVQAERRQFAVAIDTGPEIGGGGAGQFTVRLEHHFGGG
jgi:hypothetical protein